MGGGAWISWGDFSGAWHDVYGIPEDWNPETDSIWPDWGREWQCFLACLKAIGLGPFTYLGQLKHLPFVLPFVVPPWVAKPMPDNPYWIQRFIPGDPGLSKGPWPGLVRYPNPAVLGCIVAAWSTGTAIGCAISCGLSSGQAY